MEETAFYASSIVLPAEIFASAIRGHWAVENESHWVRDVTLAEDVPCRLRGNSTDFCSFPRKSTKIASGSLLVPNHKINPGEENYG